MDFGFWIEKLFPLTPNLPLMLYSLCVLLTRQSLPLLTDAAWLQILPLHLPPPRYNRTVEYDEYLPNSVTVGGNRKYLLN